MPPKAPVSRPPEPPPSSATPPSPPEADETLPWLEELPPRKIVAELDRYIVGQEAAKKAVAIAVRNRWRRGQAPEEIRRSEEHTSELQSPCNLVCRLLLEKKKK